MYEFRIYSRTLSSEEILANFQYISLNSFLSDTTEITVEVINENESPSVESTSLEIIENSAVNSAVGSELVTYDPDDGDVVTFNIII